MRKRRYERFSVNVCATMIQGRQSVQGRVVDVSFTGLFFQTNQAPPLRDLVKIDLELPTGSKLRVFGMAVHVVQAKGDPRRHPGVGVQLFGNGPEVRSEWDTFINAVRRETVRAAHENPPIGRPPDEQVALPTATEELQPPAQTLKPAAPSPGPDEPRSPDESRSPDRLAALSEDQLTQRLPLANMAPIVDSSDVDAAFERIAGPSSDEASGAAEVADAGPEPTTDDDDSLSLDVGRPELRVHLKSERDFDRLRARQARGQAVFFRTEVFMVPDTPLQIRAIRPSGKTAFIAEGRVTQTGKAKGARGLWVELNPEDVNPSEDIYITIDLESNWLENPS